MAKTAVMEDAQVLSMAQSAAFLKEFPFLARVQVKPSGNGCGGCARKRSSQGDRLTAARRAIGLLTGERAQKLKAMLGVDVIHVTYREPSGKKRRRVL